MSKTKADLEKEIKELKSENEELLQLSLSKTIELGLHIVTKEEDKQVFKNYFEMPTRDLQPTQKKAIIKELDNIILDYFEY